MNLYIFECFFVYEYCCIFIQISLKLVPKSEINTKPAMIQLMTWRIDVKGFISLKHVDISVTELCIEWNMTGALCGLCNRSINWSIMFRANLFVISALQRRVCEGVPLPGRNRWLHRHHMSLQSDRRFQWYHQRTLRFRSQCVSLSFFSRLFQNASYWITGFSFKFQNLLCCQWRQSRHHNNSRFFCALGYQKSYWWPVSGHVHCAGPASKGLNFHVVIMSCVILNWNMETFSVVPYSFDFSYYRCR